MSFFKRLFGSNEEEQQVPKAVLPPDTHILWDDDFAMVEFVPRENLDFLLSETERIREFGEQHSAPSGYGFTGVTEIGSKQVSLLDKEIDFTSLIETIERSGLTRVPHFSYQGEPLLTGENCPLGYGTKNYALMCTERNGILLDLWLSQFPRTLEEKQQLTVTLNAIGVIHDFYLVNWYNTTYCDLTDPASIDHFMMEYAHVHE